MYARKDMVSTDADLLNLTFYNDVRSEILSSGRSTCRHRQKNNLFETQQPMPTVILRRIDVKFL